MAKKNLIEKKKQNQKENHRNKFSDFSDETESEIIIGSLSSKKIMKKNSHSGKKTKNNGSISNSSILFSKSLSNDLYGENEDEDEGEDNEHSTQGSREYSLSSTKTTVNKCTIIDSTLHNDNETSTAIVEAGEYEVYLEKIKDLSDKLDEKDKIIKKQNEEIKRIQANAIGKSNGQFFK